MRYFNFPKTFSFCCGSAKPESTENSKASVTLSRWPMMWARISCIFSFWEIVFTILTKVHFLHKTIVKHFVCEHLISWYSAGWTGGTGGRCPCLQSCIWSGYPYIYMGYRRCGASPPAGTWVATPWYISYDYTSLCERMRAILRSPQMRRFSSRRDLSCDPLIHLLADDCTPTSPLCERIRPILSISASVWICVQLCCVTCGSRRPCAQFYANMISVKIRVDSEGCNYIVLSLIILFAVYVMMHPYWPTNSIC